MFLLNLQFFHFLVKFKQKITQKSKNITKKDVFEPKQVIFGLSKIDQKGQNCIFFQTYFLHFLSKFKRKIMQKCKNITKKRHF